MHLPRQRSVSSSVVRYDALCGCLSSLAWYSEPVRSMVDIAAYWLSSAHLNLKVREPI